MIDTPDTGDLNRLPPASGKEPPMTQQNDNYETPPAVEPDQYEGPPKSEQRTWNWGTSGVIVALAIIFVAVIVIYVVTR